MQNSTPIDSLIQDDGEGCYDCFVYNLLCLYILGYLIYYLVYVLNYPFVHDPVRDL